ncbi:MAG: phospholipid-binding protein MlaC [Alphaproteobacteria bacterium]
MVVVWAFAASATADETTGDAAVFIRTLGDNVFRVLSTTNTDENDRKQRYRQLLENGFAVKTIARFVLGRYWRAATPEQQQEYMVLFRDFVLETYASRLNNYSGGTFDIVDVQPLDKRDTIVATEIHSPNGPPIRVEYRVRARGKGYKIIDVLVEGVSLIATQRSEFASIITRSGIEGLLALLRERAGHTTAAN